MGQLQEKIKYHLKDAMKFKADNIKEPLRFIIGEFCREKDKDLSDDKVIKILKKIKKSENELDTPDRELINVLNIYIPKEATEDEVRKWINNNISFGDYKNNMQAMKPIMAHFAGKIDGNKVKEILLSWELKN